MQTQHLTATGIPAAPYTGAGLPANVPEHPDFLQPLPWTYGMRHRAQEILPGVFLGPFTLVRNREALSHLGITHAVAVRSAFETSYLKTVGHLDGIETLVLEAEESLAQNIITKTQAFREFINRARASRMHALAAVQSGQIAPSPLMVTAGTPAAAHLGITDEVAAQLQALGYAWSISGGTDVAPAGNVLVFDIDGVSRAPTFLIAYVMETYRLNYAQAMYYVQSRRYCVYPTKGFQHQLLELEPILAARQDQQAFVRSAEQAMQHKRGMMAHDPTESEMRPAKRAREHEEDE
ncbi:protein-tyrosine phosphatase-like protein [Blastocladiella britannica]|nr:protein-tyrosine phosphatase-like protein [Blastocladiella britannica]